MDSTMLTALSTIAVKQANPTTKILLKTKQFLDCMATNNKAIVMYQASKMILTVHSNASYLSEPSTRSWMGGHFFMSTDTAFPPNNSIALCKSSSGNVINSRSRLGALYINSKLATHNHWHPYKPTILLPMASSQTNSSPRPPKQWTCNSTGYMIANSKTNSLIYWWLGKINYAN